MFEKILYFLLLLQCLTNPVVTDKGGIPHHKKGPTSLLSIFGLDQTKISLQIPGILGLGVNQEAKERKGRGPKEGHKHGPKDRPKDLVSILGHDKMQILQQMPAGTKAAKGNDCSTPDGAPGTCSYLTDENCSPIYDVIQRRGNIEGQFLRYLLEAIQSPCGFDVVDYTICCEGSKTATPTGTQPQVTITPIGTTTPQATTAFQPLTTTTTPMSSITSSSSVKDCRVNEKTRIVGGRESRPGDWPWAVIIGHPKESTFTVICGGTLISNQHVLTAAHCFVGQRVRSTHVRVGEHDVSTANDGATPEDVAIKRVTPHQQYSPTNQRNDIAVLLLERPVVFREGVVPACLPDQFVGFDLSKLSSEPIIVGWGTNVTDGKSVNALRMAKVPIDNFDTCRANYLSVLNISVDQNQICAGNEMTDSCAGDSGGALLSDQFGRFSLIGIISFGVRCGDSQFPGIYTRVDKYLDWIEKTTLQQ